MKRNLGILDRGIRAISAIIGGLLVYFGMIVGSSSFVFLALASSFGLTSLVGFCPLYAVFGLNTQNL